MTLAAWILGGTAFAILAASALAGFQDLRTPR